MAFALVALVVVASGKMMLQNAARTLQLVNDSVAFDDVPQLSNWRYTSIITNKC